MKMPSPEDLGQAPRWETYIVTQTVRASLAQIPEHALAVGAEIRGTKVKLLFQLSKVTERDQTDMDDILSEFEAFVGQDVQVSSAYEIRERLRLSPGVKEGVWWVYVARTDEGPEHADKSQP